MVPGGGEMATEVFDGIAVSSNDIEAIWLVDLVRSLEVVTSAESWPTLEGSSSSFLLSLVCSSRSLSYQIYIDSEPAATLIYQEPWLDHKKFNVCVFP